MIETFLDGRLIVKVGDISLEDTEAIVNAANSTLFGGGGVDGAIHKRGGPQILAECRVIRETQYPGGLPTGKAVITTGGDLLARYIIHTVGPVYGEVDGNDAALLSDCYTNSIDLAAENGIRTIAFPSISTGAFGYPRHLAAGVVSAAVTSSIAKHDAIAEVRLVFFSESDARMFVKHSSLTG